MAHSFAQQQRAQVRDPIMDDNKFSLQFGNPIKVIHDIQPNSNNATPSTFMHDAPSYLPSLLTKTDRSDLDHDKIDTTRKHQQNYNRNISPVHSRVPSSSSVVRDAANFAEFYHNQDGTVNEIDHD